MALLPLAAYPARVSITAELELLCPHCEYDLRGLPDNRCPECGGTFDPEEVAACARGEARPGLPGGKRPREIFAAVMFRPGRFAREFPRGHDSGAAWCYSLGCYGLAVLLYAFAALLDRNHPLLWGGPSDALAILLAIPGALIAFAVCEVLIAAVLLLLARPVGVRRAYHFWRGLTHYTSGYTILTALWGLTAVAVACMPFSYPNGPMIVAVIMVILGIIIFAWWALALIIMVFARAGLRAGSVLGCVLIPVIGIGCTCLGFWVSFALGQLLFRVSRAS